MVSALGQRVLMRRAQDYCKKYSPQLIGISGSWGSAVVTHALQSALENHSSTRITSPGRGSPTDVASAILGVQTKTKTSWMQRLARSKVREVAEKEPKHIAVELDARRPGDIDTAARLFPFSIGMALNVHDEHLEFYNRRELVAHEITSLPLSLGIDSTAVINLDDPLLAQMADNCAAPVIGFGETAAADIRLMHADKLPSGGFALSIQTPKTSFECSFRRISSHVHVECLLGVLAIVHALGENVKRAAGQLKEFTPPAGYLSQHELSNSAVLFNDTGKATPQSIKAGIKLLAASEGKRKIAVLGDIIELGGQSTQIHTKIGQLLTDTADIFIGVGDKMRDTQGAILDAKANVDTHHFQNSKDARKWLRGTLQPNDSILIAGSPEMSMDIVVKSLVE